jgi:hypothetical protein
MIIWQELHGDVARMLLEMENERRNQRFERGRNLQADEQHVYTIGT